MNPHSEELHRLVHLRFRPLWLYVDRIREFCDFFAQATFEDPVIGERVGLVVHELVENAIRYGNERELELEIERTNGQILISVANTASDESVEKLRRTFESDRLLSPEEAYARALTRAATLAEGESGLGLPRIRCEGRFEMDLETTPGRIRITARGTA